MRKPAGEKKKTVCEFVLPVFTGIANWPGNRLIITITAHIIIYVHTTHIPNRSAAHPLPAIIVIRMCIFIRTPPANLRPWEPIDLHNIRTV